MPKFADRFAAGTPRGVSQLTKDANGRLIQWVENGFKVTVTRNAAGRPSSVTASLPSGGSLVWGFEYDSGGVFLRQSGSPIPTVFQDEILRDVASVVSASGGGSVAQASRSASFNVAQSDNNSVVTCSAALTATIPSGLDQSQGFVMEVRAGVAATITVAAGAGVTLVIAGASVANTSVTADGSSILITGSGTANKFYLNKVGS